MWENLAAIVFVAVLVCTAVALVGGWVWYLGYWLRRYRQLLIEVRRTPDITQARLAAQWAGRNAGLSEERIANDLAGAGGFPQRMR